MSWNELLNQILLNSRLKWPNDYANYYSFYERKSSNITSYTKFANSIPLSAPCPAGQYADTTTDSTSCSECAEGEYSSGGTVRSCTPCPRGKTVERGKGTQASDCYSKFFRVQYKTY